MSWHTRVVTYRRKEDRVGLGGSVLTMESTICTTRNLYFDQVFRNDIDQTAFALASIVKLVCRLIESRYQR